MSMLRFATRLPHSAIAPRGPPSRTPLRHFNKITNLPEALEKFGQNAFNELVARQYMDADTYKAYRALLTEGKPLSKTHGNIVAKAMQMWSMERGAVNFAHWFSAIRGSNAEKHDAFIDLDFSTGDIKFDFTGSKLFKGETDGSSFPSGGLRQTSNAAAYLTWDTSSMPFVRGDTLYIPSVLVTWFGQPQDDKTPLLRSQDAIDREGIRLLRLLGDNSSKSVVSNIGWEQEFFVVDRENYRRRLDLISTGRTLLGALPHKGQQTEAHYFGRIPLRVRSYLRDVQEQLWRLRISCSVLHNEVAPSQHEISPIFSLASQAADQNTVALEILQETAHQHGLIALTHEKPFAGINGSGKHNNWSINTDTGANFFKPGDTEYEQTRFFAAVAALAKTIHLHGDLLRIGVASASNDHRLGAQEAPPAIMSLYTGELMHDHIKKIIDGGPLSGYGKASRLINIGTKAVQPVEAGAEDRNRTAPFPYCGNRFEFRAVGSSANIAFPVALLNAAYADSLAELSKKIESGTSVREAVASTFREHQVAIFNGSNYSQEWRDEAKKRGLFNLKTTPEACAQLTSKKNVDLLARQKVFSDAHEVKARQEIMYQRYVHDVHIEVSTLLEMMNAQVIPALIKDLSNANASTGTSLTSVVKRKDALYGKVLKATEDLEKLSKQSHDGSLPDQAKFAETKLLPAMKEIRSYADQAEKVCEHNLWPFPKYDELIYSHHVQGDGEF